MSQCFISATLTEPDLVCCRPEDTPTLHHGVLGLPAHAALPHEDHLLLLQGLLVVLQLETGVGRCGGDAGRGGVALLQKSLKLARGGLQYWHHHHRSLVEFNVSSEQRKVWCKQWTKRSLMQAIKRKSLMQTIEKENHLDIILGTAFGQHQFRFRPEKDDDDDNSTVEAKPSTTIHRCLVVAKNTAMLPKFQPTCFEKIFLKSNGDRVQKSYLCTCSWTELILWSCPSRCPPAD